MSEELFDEDAIVPRSVDALLHPVLVGAIRVYQPLATHVIRVRDWFGPRWLGFRGRSLGALEYHSTASGTLIVPPFIPSRVIEHATFTREATAAPWHRVPSPPLHIYQHSESNLRRRFADVVGPSATAIWLGGDDTRSRCALLYATSPDSKLSWYADAAHADRLELAGITPREIDMLREAGRTAA